jgi:hypothetical protein
MKTPEPTPPKPGEISSLVVLGARLTWIAVGPLALAGITYGIVSTGTGWLTGLDAAFGVVVVLMLVGRWVEQRSGTATTLTGEPATGQWFRRYALLLPALAVATWIVANAVGLYVLR